MLHNLIVGGLVGLAIYLLLDGATDTILNQWSFVDER